MKTHHIAITDYHHWINSIYKNLLKDSGLIKEENFQTFQSLNTMPVGNMEVKLTDHTTTLLYSTSLKKWLIIPRFPKYGNTGYLKRNPPKKGL